MSHQRKNEVVTKGIPDAYVVAYYRGKRISIGEANQLLASGIVPEKRGEVAPVAITNEVQLATTIEIPTLKPLVKRVSTIDKPIPEPAPVIRIYPGLFSATKFFMFFYSTKFILFLTLFFYLFSNHHPHGIATK